MFYHFRNFSILKNIRHLSLSIRNHYFHQNGIPFRSYSPHAGNFPSAHYFCEGRTAFGFSGPYYGNYNSWAGTDYTAVNIWILKLTAGRNSDYTADSYKEADTAG